MEWWVWKSRKVERSATARPTVILPTAGGPRLRSSIPGSSPTGRFSAPRFLVLTVPGQVQVRVGHRVREGAVVGDHEQRGVVEATYERVDGDLLGEQVEA